jgi:hypothetical protein
MGERGQARNRRYLLQSHRPFLEKEEYKNAFKAQ